METVFHCLLRATSQLTDDDDDDDNDDDDDDDDDNYGLTLI